jgi:uncharacterized protein with PQ loop repeat
MKLYLQKFLLYTSMTIYSFYRIRIRYLYRHLVLRPSPIACFCEQSTQKYVYMQEPETNTGILIGIDCSSVRMRRRPTMIWHCTELVCDCEPSSFRFSKISATFQFLPTLYLRVQRLYSKM